MMRPVFLYIMPAARQKIFAEASLVRRVGLFMPHCLAAFYSA